MSLDPATWPLIGKVIELFSGAAEKLIPDRNQRFSMSTDASTGNIRLELGGNWFNSTWRAMIGFAACCTTGWWLVMDKPWDVRFLFLASISLLTLGGYTLNRETLSNVVEFLKMLMELKRQNQKEK